MASAIGERSSFPLLKVVSYGYTTFGRKGDCCLRNPQLYFSPQNLGSSNNSSVTLPPSSTFAHSTYIYLPISMSNFGVCTKSPLSSAKPVITTTSGYKPCHSRQRKRRSLSTSKPRRTLPQQNNVFWKRLISFGTSLGALNPILDVSIKSNNS